MDLSKFKVKYFLKRIKLSIIFIITFVPYEHFIIIWKYHGGILFLKNA